MKCRHLAVAVVLLAKSLSPAIEAGVAAAGAGFSVARWRAQPAAFSAASGAKPAVRASAAASALGTMPADAITVTYGS